MVHCCAVNCPSWHQDLGTSFQPIYTQLPTPASLFFLWEVPGCLLPMPGERGQLPSGIPGRPWADVIGGRSRRGSEFLPEPVRKSNAAMSGGGSDQSPEWVREGSQTLGTLQSMCQEAAGSGHTWWSLRFMAWALAQQQGPGRTALSASGCRAQSRVPHASRGFPDLDAGCGAQSRVPTPPEVSLGGAGCGAQSRVPHTTRGFPGLRAGSLTLPEGSLGSEQGPPHCQSVLWAGC